MRIRTIKPEFYQSEALGRVPREDRLLAAALITWADDEGYFVSIPAVIAGSLFPFDEDGKVFVAEGLERLHAIGFAVLFEGNVGHLPGFQRNQRINRPSESRLKPKALVPLQFSEPSVSPHGVLSEPSHTEGKGMEGKGTEGKGHVQSTCVEVRSEEHPLKAAWNDNRASAMPAWSSTGKTRRRHADARLREHSVEWWVAVVKRLAASDFASGRSGKWNATVDWLLGSPDNATKTLEGAYDNRAPTGPNLRAPAPVADWSQPLGDVSL